MVPLGIPSVLRILTYTCCCQSFLLEPLWCAVGFGRGFNFISLMTDDVGIFLWVDQPLEYLLLRESVQIFCIFKMMMMKL